MNQVISGRASVSLGTGTSYVWPTGTPTWDSTEARINTPWLAAGVFRNLIVTLATAPGAGTSRTFALRINGATSALTVTISGTATTATLSGTDVTVAVNDLVNLIQTTSGSVATVSQIKLSLEFVGNVTGESCYLGNAGTPSNAAVSYDGLFSAPGNWPAAVTQTQTNVVPTAGTITSASMAVSTATGAGKTRTLAIYKNGVKQDGSGGTVDTRVSLSDASALKTTAVTFSLSVVAGDLIYIEHTPAGTPTSARVMHGYKFVATVDGQSIVCGTSNPSTSATRYACPSVTSSGSSSLTETNTDLDGGVTTATLKSLYAAPDVAPGSGKTYTVSLRLNATSPAGTPSVAVTGTGTAAIGDTTDTLAVTTGDVWTVRFVETSTPAAALIAWGIVSYIVPSGGGGGGSGAYGPTRFLKLSTVNLYGAH